MIKNISEMLLKFMEAEKKKLADYQLQHNPTIGDMYEGLSAKILDSTIPTEFDIRVVDGFVTDAEGNLSGQIDCMLVVGDGEEIPYTQSYKWPVWDVLAVVEVKKNLYGSELADSFLHLREITESYSNWLFANGGETRTFSLVPAMRAFSTITGVHAPKYSERETLPQALQLIYHTLVLEQLAPVLLVFGYDGYRSEQSLREGLYKFLKETDSGKGYGVPSFPHQITCNGFSLLKANGQPYMSPMIGDRWTFYTSTKANPLWVMIELIWTKLSHRFETSMPWGEDLDVEVINRLLEAKPVLENESGGWMLNYIPMSKDHEVPVAQEAWAPTFVDSKQFVIFESLCREDCVDTTDPGFVKFVESDGVAVNDFIEGLRKTGLVALDGNRLRLTTVELQCAIFPDGGFAVAENNTGRMTRYMYRRMGEKKV